jgi:hypothetical protein
VFINRLWSSSLQVRRCWKSTTRTSKPSHSSQPCWHTCSQVHIVISNYVNVYIYIFIHVHLNMNVNRLCVIFPSHVGIHALHTYICIYVYKSIFYKCFYINMNIHICIYFYLCVHAYVCINTYINMYVYTYVYAYMCVLIFVLRWTIKQGQ